MAYQKPFNDKMSKLNIYAQIVGIVVKISIKRNLWRFSFIVIAYRIMNVVLAIISVFHFDILAKSKIEKYEANYLAYYFRELLCKDILVSAC